jgi:hypothetical protein
MDVNDSEVENKDALIHFKNLLKADTSNWADFELAIGKYSTEFENADDFIDCVDDFTNNFKLYLSSESQKLTLNRINAEENVIYPFLQTLRSLFTQYCKTKEQVDYSSISFLQFNYTNIFDIVYEELRNYEKSNKEMFTQVIIADDLSIELSRYFSLNYNLHIHGTLDGYPIIGVDNIDQINNTAFRKSDDVISYLIKGNMMNTFTTFEGMNFTNVKPLALETLKNSDYIFSYGTSIGETDKVWWKAVGDWLRANRTHKFIVITKAKGKSDSKSPIQRHIFKESSKNIETETRGRFYKLAEWNTNIIMSYSENIVFDFNTDIFKLKFERTEDKTLQPA